MRYDSSGNLKVIDAGGGGGGGDATAANQASQIALETDINAELDAHSAKLDSILAQLQNTVTPTPTTNPTQLPPALSPGGRVKVETSRKFSAVSGTLTRPADTAAYANGDQISNSTISPTAQALANCAQLTGGGGVILQATLSDSAGSASPLSPEVWVWSVARTPNNDNAQFAPSSADLANRVCVIQFDSSYAGAPAGASGNRVYQSAMLSHAFVCAAGSTSLYWELVCRSASGYTPVSGEQFALALSLLQN